MISYMVAIMMALQPLTAIELTYSDHETVLNQAGQLPLARSSSP